ncbi:MAG: sulfatase-like hydrolase/transferase, partial [Holophagae bacterium]|nr:sulfatase-like hydrolase/transferase [Holophagae bacterium]
MRAGGRRDDTLVLFTVDHGVDLPRAKQTLYDSGVQTPLVFWGPAWLGTAKIETLSSHCDILPTVCEIAGVRTPEGLDGVSLLPAMESGARAREAVFFEKGWD